MSNFTDTEIEKEVAEAALIEKYIRLAEACGFKAETVYYDNPDIPFLRIKRARYSISIAVRDFPSVLSIYAQTFDLDGYIDDTVRAKPELLSDAESRNTTVRKEVKRLHGEAKEIRMRLEILASIASATL